MRSTETSASSDRPAGSSDRWMCDRGRETHHSLSDCATDWTLSAALSHPPAPPPLCMSRTDRIDVQLTRDNSLAIASPSPRNAANSSRTPASVAERYSPPAVDRTASHNPAGNADRSDPTPPKCFSARRPAPSFDAPHSAMSGAREITPPDSSRVPGGRQPVVVPRNRGDSVVNVSTLWPERAAAASSSGVIAAASNGSGSGSGINGGYSNATTRRGHGGAFVSSGSKVAEGAGASSTPFFPPGTVVESSFVSGADIIVQPNTGRIGPGAIVAEDGNVHHDAAHKRPVVLLPPCCEGALGLKIPELIKGHVANVTLPSRLALLGRLSYETIAALNPINLGNSVLGFAPVWGQQTRLDLYVLPYVFSKGGARITFFLRILIVLVFLAFFFQFVRVWTLNIGRAWLLGTAVAIYVMYKLALIRRAPDGVMAFCRSMGAPEIEEYMFSYAWKVEPDAIRTLAKAVWNNGVGVWIDVVKLCPGDEIRPMVRTMVNRVHRCVVFLSPTYIASANCCVEFHEAVQWPEKLVICILQPVPQLEPFLQMLQSRGAVVVVGLRALITQLDNELCDVNDSAAWKWWRKQKISGGGVPSHVVPTYWHSIPRFKLTGTIRVPQRALTAGPAYLAGDCSSQGYRFFPPYLFILALLALAANFIDLFFTFRNSKCDDMTSGCVDNSNCHTIIDYVWLGVMAACNLAPFTAWSSLFDTRTEVHPVLRPLLASKSMNGGVRITIQGDLDDPIVANLNKFLTSIGHNAADRSTAAAAASADAASKRSAELHRKQNSGGHGVQQSNGALDNVSIGDELAAPQKESGAAARSKVISISEAPGQRDRSCASQAKGKGGLAAGFSQSITVYVMRSFAQRDALFGSDDFPFDPRTSLFVWSDPTGDPFTKDEIGSDGHSSTRARRTAGGVWHAGMRCRSLSLSVVLCLLCVCVSERLMRFLVLVAAWDRKLLAENLFSAIGVRVVDMLHSADLDDQEQIDSTLGQGDAVHEV